MATLIKTDGTRTKVELGVKTSLEDLQKYVGGYIAYVPGKDGNKLIINDEGRLLKLKDNPEATKEYLYGYIQTLVGDCLLVEPDEFDFI